MVQERPMGATAPRNPGRCDTNERVATREEGEQRHPPALQQRAVAGMARSYDGGLLPGGSNGIVSGATAPPLMMKLIAWSTVQSVGVIFSTGTISR